MPNFERNIKKSEIINDITSSEINLGILVEKEAQELSELANKFFVSDSTIDSLSLLPSELSNGKEELIQINSEGEKILDGYKEESEAILDNSEYEVAKEGWRKSAEEQFGIIDFDLDIFKRQIYDQDKIAQVFASGKDWNYVFDDENINGFITGESYDQAVKVFEIMTDLENEVQGSVKILHERFGISNFQRYPKDILLNQLEENNQQKEVGLMIFAKNDHNGAFDNQGNIWDKIYKQQKNDLNFRIFECGSKESLVEQLVKVKEDFVKKVSLISLSAHSEPEGFFLGGGFEDGSFMSHKDIEDVIPLMKDILADQTQMIANACSSGAINGWVKKLSKEIRIKGVGPDRPAAIEDVDFIGKEIVPKYYDNDIYSGYHNGFLLSKKRKG